MNKNKILVILGHPKTDSFCGALFKAFIEGAKTNGMDVREIRIGELIFDPVLWKGYDIIQDLEPDLVKCQDDILWAEHIVFVYPTWWGAMPALLKGFIDRTFLPGFSYKFHDGSKFWDKLLSGRSSQLLVTMDTPAWYYRWVYRKPGHNQMKRTVLEFCGIKVNKITEFAPIKGSSQKKREKWLKVANDLGKKSI
jgi:putative NADPH-quinone reductase